MSTQRRPEPREAGFTLVELLVSLALMAAAAGLLVASLSTGRNMAARVAERAEATGGIAAAQLVLRQRIEAMTVETRFDASAPYADIRGDAYRLNFTAPAPDALRPAPPRRYRLMFERGTVVLYAVDPQTYGVDADAPAVRGWTAYPLVSGAAAMTIGYFGVGPPDNERRWRGFWIDRPAAPELVRVRVTFPPGDPRRWPDLIVRPFATINSACRPDPVTGACRQGAA